jgi:hypothetical protein
MEMMYSVKVDLVIKNLDECRMSHNGYQPAINSSLHQEGTMELYIETLTGTAFEMTVSPFDTVMSIKSKIQRVEGKMSAVCCKAVLLFMCCM